MMRGGFCSANIYLTTALVLVLCHCGYAQDTALLKVYSSLGRELGDRAVVEENSVIILECTYQQASLGENRKLLAAKFYVKRSVNDEWSHQVSCENSHSEAKFLHRTLNSSFKYFTTANTTCKGNAILTATLSMSSQSPPYYQCGRWHNGTRDFFTTNKTIWTSIKPTEPKVKRIKPVGGVSPALGDEVIYECTSTAKPPPKLKLKYKDGGQVPPDELVHVPPTASITEHSLKGMSTLTWTTTATVDLNERVPICEISNHLSSQAIPSPPINMTDCLYPSMWLMVVLQVLGALNACSTA